VVRALFFTLLVVGRPAITEITIVEPLTEKAEDWVVAAAGFMG
jgi:hypothetical protein